MSPEVGDSRETLAYFFCYVQAPFLSTCGGVADLSASCAIAIVAMQLR